MSLAGLQMAWAVSGMCPRGFVHVLILPALCHRSSVSRRKLQIPSASTACVLVAALRLLCTSRLDAPYARQDVAHTAS